MKGKIAILILVSVVFNSAVIAQKTRELTQEEENNKKSTQKRVALVIGNGAYTKAKPLVNPSNDAADMAKALRELGFEVISGVNQNKRQMETLIREFGTKLAASGGVGLFYYAGHGLQVAGENYLVPVDADIPEEDEVSYSAVPIGLVLGKMQTAKNDLNIIILDACRNNPFARSWRSYRDSSNNDGLAKISPPTGTLVLYATEPGKVASDGAGRNGLFTEALLKQIKRPDLEYDQMVKALSADVWQKSNRQQLPWKEGNSLQNFYFAGNKQKPNAIINPISSEKTNEPIILVKDKATQEKEAWDLVKNSTDAEDLRLFLKEFPNGANSELAKTRLEELVWFSVKTSNDKTKVQAYLNEFPGGQNASSARILLRQLEAKNKATNNTPQVELNKDDEKWIKLNVKVSADNTANGWTNTGWLVKKGNRIRIKASGKVSLGNGTYSSPAGVPSLADKDKLIPGRATGALIAVIGDDNNEFIFIGESLEFTAARTGALFLGVNEGNLDDNSGAFEVTVEISKD